MSLHFQKEDEVDREMKEAGITALWVCIIIFVLFAAIDGLFAWLGGSSLKAYGRDLGWLIVLILAASGAFGFYKEIRVRLREIDGKVSAIEEAVNAAKKERAGLLERLSAIEDELRSLKCGN